MILDDEILTLRAPEPSDLDVLYLWENDTSLWNAGNAVSPYSRKQLWEYIDTYEADIFVSRQLRFVVVEKLSGAAVGTIDLFDFDPVNRHASVGILIDREYRGRRYASHAVKIVCRYCAEHIGMHSLAAVCESSNSAGISTFKACGFSSVGCLRSWIRHGKVYADAVLLQRLFP